MRGCRHARQRIFREVDQSLTLEERFLLEEHLAVCPSCQDLHARSLGLEEALVRMPEPAQEGLDLEGAVASIRRRLDAGEAQPERVGGHRTWRPLVFAAAAAAVLALAALGWWRYEGEEAPETARARTDELPTSIEPGVSTEPVELDADSVLSAMRTAFLASTDERWDASVSPADEVVARFEQGSQELMLWPLPRLAEKLLSDPDPEVARIAARYLGLRGDRISAFRLEDTLMRAEVAPAAVRALGDLGPRGVSVLAKVIHDPDRTDLVLVELMRVGGPEAAAAIERALLDAPTVDAHAERLLSALAATGPAAVEPLLRLAQHRSLADAQPLRRLVDVEGGEDELLRLLDDWTERQPIEVYLEAVAVLQPPGANHWVEERIQELRYRQIALGSLVTWQGPAPVHSLLRLDAEGRVPDDDLLWALEELAERDPQRLAEAARDLLLAGDSITAGRYLELLLVSGDAAVAPALSPFVRSEILSDGERQLAALAIGEIGDEDDALALLRGLEHLGSDDERLYAACLITVYRLLGEPGVSEAMAGLSPGSTRQVRTALSGVGDGAAGAIGLSRVARALDGALTKNPKTRNPVL